MPSMGSRLDNDVPPRLIARCCDGHDDWETLAQHVANDFPDAPLDEIVREIRTARHAIELAALHDDNLLVAELILRHRLLVCVGGVDDSARLDPQPHPSRVKASAET